MVAIQYLHGQVRMVALPASSRTRAALASGFTGKRPKSLINDVGAIAAGSVYGVLVDASAGPAAAEKIFKGLRAYDFERRLVHHSNGLKKVEVRQLNTVLADLLPD